MSNPNNPFRLDFGEEDDLEATYVPPPLNTGAWETGLSPAAAINTADSGEDEEPFTAAHLAPSPKQPEANPFVATTTLDEGSMAGTMRRPPPPPSFPPSQSAPSASLLPDQVLPSAPVVGVSVGDDPSSYPFYNIKRYRSFFNVDTSDVLQRMFASTVLFFKGNFLEAVSERPDLYGPFWVASTLVFVSAATGNYAGYLAHTRKGGVAPPPPGQSTDAPAGWYYDIDKVGGSMGLFYGYVSIVGLALWGALRWFKSNISLAQVWCAYGYSMCVFIPMAVVCVVPIDIVRWAVVGAATFVSGLFLLLTFRGPVMESEAGARASPLLLVIIGAHACLGLALKLYFFNY